MSNDLWIMSNQKQCMKNQWISIETNSRIEMLQHTENDHTLNGIRADRQSLWSIKCTFWWCWDFFSLLRCIIMRCCFFCFDLSILLWNHLDWELSFVANKNNVITCAIIKNENHAFCLTLKYLMEKETEKSCFYQLNKRVWYKNNTSDSFAIVHIFFHLEKQQHLNRSLPWTHNLTLKFIQKHHIWHLYFNVFNNYAAIFGEKNKLVSFNFRYMPWSYDSKKTMLGNFEKENCKITSCATVLKINPMKVKTVSLFTLTFCGSI